MSDVLEQSLRADHEEAPQPSGTWATALEKIRLPKPRIPTVVPPFEALGVLSERQRIRLREEALRVNERYLREFIEGSSFCPYAKQGRRSGQTSRYVFLFEELDVKPLVDLMKRISEDPKQVVAQVILPLVDVDPEAWRKFCMDVTALGHHELGKPVLACAPLHPSLPYSDESMYSLVPLFRRAPDPTIQWVRLDGLDALYAGRGSDNEFVHIDNLGLFFQKSSPPRPPLYDVVCKTNAAMARRMTIERVVKTLDELAADGRRSYARILLDEATTETETQE